MNWKYNLGLEFKDIAQKNSNKLAIIIDNKRYNYKYLEDFIFFESESYGTVAGLVIQNRNLKRGHRPPQSKPRRC